MTTFLIDTHLLLLHASQHHHHHLIPQHLNTTLHHPLHLYLQCDTMQVPFSHAALLW